MILDIFRPLVLFIFSNLCISSEMGVYLLPQFYSDLFLNVTGVLFRSEDVHVVRIFSSTYFFQLRHLIHSEQVVSTWQAQLHPPFYFDHFFYLSIYLLSVCIFIFILFFFFFFFFFWGGEGGCLFHSQNS